MAEQSEWIGALLVESFLSQKSCVQNKTFLSKTFEYLNLSNELLEKNISLLPEQPLQCLFPVITFKQAASSTSSEIDVTSPSLSSPPPPPPTPADDEEVKLEKFIALKMVKDQDALAATVAEAKTLDEKVANYHTFMEYVFPRAARVCQLLKYGCEETLYKALECVFCPKIYDEVFPVSPSEDAAFATQAARLRSKESFLGVTPDIIQKIRNVYAVAGSELEQMERHVSPYAKLACMGRCLNILMHALGRVGADDLLPAVIYTIVQCSPSRLPSNLQYTMMFGYERAFNTQEGYCHTTMMVAMEVVSRHKFDVDGNGYTCPKCQGIGGLNRFGEPCKQGENLYQMECPTCDGACFVSGSPKMCEQCLGKGGRAKLGYCELTDPFVVGKCEVCHGKSYLIGDLSSTPPPTSPLSSFSQYYGSELTPSKYGFYRHSSTCQVERIMLPDLISALILFSLTDSASSKRNPRATATFQLPTRPTSELATPNTSTTSLNSSIKPVRPPRPSKDGPTSPTNPPRNPEQSKSPVRETSEAWRRGVKKEITVFYPAPVRSALKRTVHCLRSLANAAKRDKERDVLIETSEQAIALKWTREMVDGRHLLSGEGYGINLGSDGVKELYFHRVDPDPHHNTPEDSALPHMTALITVMGVIDPNSEETTTDFDILMRDQIDADCDKYILVWETQHLRRFGATVKMFHHTSMQEARSSTSFPIAPTMIANQMKNSGVFANHPYVHLLQQAKKGGRLLAEKIIRMGLGRRPVTLVGVSAGALLVFYALEILIESLSAYPHVASVVENVIFVGANIPADTSRWSAIKPLVSGRIVNCYSKKDAFLKYFYQTVNTLTNGGANSAAGVTAIPVTNIENVDITSLITSHAYYAKNEVISSILNFVDVTGVECNKHYTSHLPPSSPIKPLSAPTSATAPIDAPQLPPPPVVHQDPPASIVDKFVNTLHHFLLPT